MSRISVVTICFNNLEELKKTCTSVDEQHELPYEHLIIDGSKTDEIAKWLNSSSQPVYRKWICEPDKGIADAFNKGIQRSTGEVASVAVFSEVPMEEIDTVILDYQSRTSVLLCKILFEKHWKKKVQFIDAQDNSYIERIKGNVAGLVIGDRALSIRHRFSYIYDLGLGWKEMTGLPFVFAVWVTKKEISGDFIPLFNEANEMGLSKINLIINQNNESSYPMDMYFRKNISYVLTEDMRESMRLYLSFLKNI